MNILNLKINNMKFKHNDKILLLNKFSNIYEK